MTIREMNYKDGAALLLNRLSRLTVLRFALDEPPFTSLGSLLRALYTTEPFDAAQEYHVLTCALVTGGCRRVSGDVFHDFLLHLLLERENAFSRAAARGEWDEPLSAAMRQELTHFDSFFALNSVTLKGWMTECMRDYRNKQRTTPAKDPISVLSSAVWSGGTTRPLPQPPASNAPVQEPRAPAIAEQGDYISWRYQPEENTQEYASDTTLEEIYRRLLKTGERGLLLDDLWNFHAAFGTGMFLKDRMFTLDIAGNITPIPTPPEEDQFSFYHPQREQALRNVIRFMQGERADNMLITGNAGAGKTTQMFALARELPELRLLCCPAGAQRALMAALPRLNEQPLKFLVFLDDFSPRDPDWLRLKCTLAPTGTQRSALLIAAAAREGDDAFFPLKIALPPPQLKEFIELVQVMLLQRGRDQDFDSVQNACIDYAATAGTAGGSPLSYRSAGVIVDRLLNQ